MKAYLSKIMQLIALSEEDCAFLYRSFDVVVQNHRAADALKTVLDLYEKDYNCDDAEILHLADTVAQVTGLHAYTARLLVILLLTRHTEELYQSAGLPYELYFHTMQDIRYKVEECKLVKGVVGVFTFKWFFGFFRLTRFALGRLQFELKDFGRCYENDGLRLVPESKVINVHIPRTGTKLDADSCNLAFAQAAEFFSPSVSRPCAFVCKSWLLYPALKHVLPEKSNVYRFMSRFDIIESVDDPQGNDLWRIFDTDEKDPLLLPTDSKLKEAIATHLRNGSTIGWGRGVYIYGK